MDVCSHFSLLYSIFFCLWRSGCSPASVFSLWVELVRSGFAPVDLQGPGKVGSSQDRAPGAHSGSSGETLLFGESVCENIHDVYSQSWSCDSVTSQSDTCTQTVIQNIQQLQPVLYKSYLDCSKINNSWVHCLYSACMFILKCFCNLILVIRFLFIKEMMVWMCFCCNQISTVTMQSLQPSAINTPLLWSVIFFSHPVCRPLIKSSSLSSFREGV